MRDRTHEAPLPVPVPEDFPVQWEDPEDEQLHWTNDPAHAPHQVTALDFDACWVPASRGMTRAARHYEIPLREYRARRINTYYYSAVVPLIAPPREMADMARRMEENIGSAIARLAEDWNTQTFPEIKAQLEAMSSDELLGVELRDLLVQFDDVRARMERLWELHFRTALPAHLAVSEFDELYRDLFGPKGSLDAYQLLGGFPTKTLETGQSLWLLGRRAASLPSVRQVLQHAAIADVLPLLESTEQGRDFLRELQSYLETHGHRSDSWAIARPTWIEDPTPVIHMLKDNVFMPDSAGPIVAAEARAKERELAVADARKRLASHSRLAIEQFEFLLAAAQTGNVLAEDSGYYVGSGLYALRRLALALGRHLADAEVLQSQDDIFQLTFEELRDAAGGASNLDCRSLVAKRRAEMERFRSVRVPRELGTAPSSPPPPDDPFGRFYAKFYGTATPPPDRPDVLQGTAASSGRAVGPARIIRSLADATRLQPGDVLVAETTLPTWTPLFTTAAAVVTETGGILSHCAVVAREYQIPAVVGVRIATSAIPDGQLVEVDGTRGTVRTLPQA